MRRASFLPLLTNSLVVAGLWVGTRFLQRSRPVEYTYLVLEDGWVEYGSFAAWTLATTLFIWAFVHSRSIRRWVYVLLALCACFMAMEEISWGQRVLGWQGPDLLTEGNLQAETNLHNLVTVTKIYRPLAAVIVWWCVLPWLLTRLFPRLRELCELWAIPIIPLRLWPWFFLAAIFLVQDFRPRNHEVGELFLAMAVAILALDSVSAMKVGFLSRVQIAVVPLVGVAVLLAATSLTVLVFPEPGKAVFGRHLNRLGYHRLVQGWNSHALIIYEYIAAHPEHLGEDGQLFHAMALRGAGRDHEVERALEGYQGLQGVVGSLVPKDPEGMHSAERALRLGMALCLSGQRSEARALFEGIAKRERSNLAGAGSAIEQGEARYQISAALLAQGYDKNARRQVEKASRTVGPRYAKSLRARYRETEQLLELAGCD